MVKTTVQDLHGHTDELVEQASRGEEVLITVDGQVKARLTKAGNAIQESRPADPEDTEKWLERLRASRRAASTGKKGPTGQEILDEMREERL